MVRHIVTLMVLLAVAAAAVWALWPKPVAVETAAIGRRDIDVMVEEEGKSRIREVFTVSAPIAGQLERVNLHAGDTVQRGKTAVASIRPADPSLLDARARRVAEAQVAAAHAAVELATAELRQSEAQLEFAKSDLARATELVRKGTISSRAFDKARLDTDTAAAAAQSARAQLVVRQRELDSAKAALTDGSAAASAACCYEVMAPVSGLVLKVVTESAQVVQAGTPLVEIGDPADLEIVTDLLSRDAVRIAVGAAAVIDNWGGPPLAARVTRIDPLAVTKVSALGIEEQRVPVVLALEGGPAQWTKLGHDFRVVTRISLWHGSNLPAVPIGALFRNGEGWAVFAAANGKARLRHVKLGQRNADFAEITDGLAEGDTVILHPSDRVAEGVRIAAVPAD